MPSPNIFIALLLSSLLVCTGCKGRHKEEESNPYAELLDASAVLAEAYVGVIEAIKRLTPEIGNKKQEEPIEDFLDRACQTINTKYFDLVKSGSQAQQDPWKKAEDAVKEAYEALYEAREEEENAPYGVAVECNRRAATAYDRAAEAIQKVQEIINEVKK